jgi:hypothetical protein
LNFFLLGSHESYIRCILDSLVNPPHNYRGIVINFRGCAESDITSPRLYSAVATDDIRSVMRYIRKCIPNAPLLGIGFSMGASILVKVFIILLLILLLLYSFYKEIIFKFFFLYNSILEKKEKKLHCSLQLQLQIFLIWLGSYIYIFPFIPFLDHLFI